MASLPYPLNRLVYSYCQCGCHHSIGLYTHVCVGMAGMPYPPTDTHSSVFKKPVLLFFCLFNNNMFSCPLVFSTTTCSHVLLSFQQQPVLMFSCLSKKHVLLSFPQKNHILHPILSLCRQKKTAESNAPSR